MECYWDGRVAGELGEPSRRGADVAVDLYVDPTVDEVVPPTSDVVICHGTGRNTIKNICCAQ